MRGGLALGVVVLGWATIAAAADPCRGGDSTLGDQRALATLTTAIDTNCPCATATNRHVYVHCAREQITAALHGGMLRRECLSTARRLYRDAVCATTRVACGRYAMSDELASCRLATADACHPSGDLVLTACSEQTRCADVVDQTAGTCLDPHQRGPFGVGVRTVTLTKDSMVDPGTERELDTVIWYPAAPGSGPEDPGLKGVVDAPLDNSGGPYPLLLFSHGSCGYPFQSTFLTPLLASYGIVVAAPPHPGNEIYDFPTCMTATSLVASLQERPADIIFVTDQMLTANADGGSPFFGAIDSTRIGMSGHSFGGLTTYLVAAADSRFRVAVALAPAAPRNSPFDIPSLNMLSELDSYVNNDAIHAAYDGSTQPKVEVEIAHTGHFAYSDGCFPSPDCNPPTTLTQDEAHAIVLRWVVPFVLRYLKGDERYDPFLENVPPGVTVHEAR